MANSQETGEPSTDPSGHPGTRPSASIYESTAYEARTGSRERWEKLEKAWRQVELIGVARIAIGDSGPPYLDTVRRAGENLLSRFHLIATTAEELLSRPDLAERVRSIGARFEHALEDYLAVQHVAARPDLAKRLAAQLSSMKGGGRPISPDTAQRWASWQTLADDIWARNPKLSASRVAAKVREQMVNQNSQTIAEGRVGSDIPSARTIRRRISRPKGVGQ